MKARDWRRARHLAVNERRLLRRHALGTLAVALLHGLLVVVLWRLGALRPGGVWLVVVLGGLTLLLAVYLLLILRGAFAGWREPSLSMPLAVGMIAVFLATAYWLDGTRIIAMLLFYPLLLQVSFRLGAGTLLVLAVLASLGYAGVLALAIINRPLNVSVTVESLQWLVFTLVSLSFVITGSGVNGLRRSLAVKNRALTDALEQVRDLAIRDDLTGMFNRRHIMEVLEHQKGMADNGIAPFSVCYVDLDSFKRINDEFGHDWGDRVLRDFAEHTQGNLREGDYLARLGGEEFILVLPDSDLEGAVLVAERLRESWAEYGFSTEGGPPAVSLSVGVACYRDGETIDQLMARADHALYRAKSGGRNRVCRAP